MVGEASGAAGRGVHHAAAHEASVTNGKEQGRTGGYRRRRCLLLEELKEAALYGDGSPVKAWTPNGGKVGRKKVGAR